ncbi:MAG: RNA 2',3'-cyclic phosphodiesterase [Candidatus Latescibacteria bacterium]|nr:RNA 2',3'-cyclic phosphodiesterase [Candidatus Latescibacterota bacterium]
MIRSFIALPLPGAVQSALGELARQLAAQSQGVKWVKPENIHLTLRFLGDTAPEKVPALSAGLDAFAVQPPFFLRLGQIGAFPNLHKARVMWVGLEEEGEQLHQLQQAVETLARSLGWEHETQDFKPHLTLGRVREGGRVPQEVPTVPPLEFQADRIELIESRLKPAGPEYLTLHRAVLGASA